MSKPAKVVIACAERRAYGLREQPRARVVAGNHSELDPEQERRVGEAARHFGKLVEHSRLRSDAIYSLGQIIGTQWSKWFDAAMHGYSEYSGFESGTKKYERARALDAWISISLYWMHFAPFRRTFVYLALHGLMEASGAPLPAKYQSATKARKRTVRAVGKALDPSSAMSAGWRQHWLDGFPLTAAALLNLGPLPVWRGRDGRTQLPISNFSKKSVPL
jgi:hypothetical protein